MALEAYLNKVTCIDCLALMDANGETEAAANEYKQHISAMDAQAIAEFNRVLATAAANLQAGVKRSVG